MKKLIVVLFLMVLSTSVFSQVDSTEIKLVNSYNETAKQIEQLIEQEGMMKGYLQYKGETLKSYGLIDSAMIANNVDLKTKLETYQKLEEQLKKISDAIPALKGRLQAIGEDINELRKKRGDK